MVYSGYGKEKMIKRAVYCIMTVLYLKEILTNYR